MSKKVKKVKVYYVENFYRILCQKSHVIVCRKQSQYGMSNKVIKKSQYSRSKIVVVQYVKNSRKQSKIVENSRKQSQYSMSKIVIVYYGEKRRKQIIVQYGEKSHSIVCQKNSKKVIVQYVQKSPKKSHSIVFTKKSKKQSQYSMSKEYSQIKLWYTMSKKVR